MNCVQFSKQQIKENLYYDICTYNYIKLKRYIKTKKIKQKIK